MPFCTYCGCKVSSEMRFCPGCGQRTTQQSASRNTGRAEQVKEEAQERKQPVNPMIKNSRLYHQWVKYAGLPKDEATPPGEEPGLIRVRREEPVTGRSTGEKPRQDFRFMFIGMGLIIVGLVAGLVVLLLKFLEQ